MSSIAFAIGLIFATNAGNYWLDIFNDYSASINLLVIGILQFVVVAWVRKYNFEKTNFPNTNSIIKYLDYLTTDQSICRLGCVSRELGTNKMLGLSATGQ